MYLTYLPRYLPLREAGGGSAPVPVGVNLRYFGLRAADYHPEVNGAMRVCGVSHDLQAAKASTPHISRGDACPLILLFGKPTARAVLCLYRMQRPTEDHHYLHLRLITAPLTGHPRELVLSSGCSAHEGRCPETRCAYPSTILSTGFSIAREHPISHCWQRRWWTLEKLIPT